MTKFSFTIGNRHFFCSDLDTDDAIDVIDLHRQVFGSDADIAWWNWKYNTGTAAGIRDEEGRLIAHCGGIPRQLTCKGKSIKAIQIGDVMVAPEIRGLLTRRGPFFQVSQHFYTSRIGANQAFEIAFGFPSERHLTLAVHLNLLLPGQTIFEQEWSTTTKSPWGWCCNPISPNDPNFNKIADTAWINMRESLDNRLTGQRNADYLRWRYFDRPDRKYLFFQLQRIWQHPLGMIVLRKENDEQMVWLDWIGNPTHLPLAARMARATAQKAGAKILTALTSAKVAEDLETECNRSPKVIAKLGIPATSLITPDEIDHTHWWWMGGDTDFL